MLTPWKESYDQTRQHIKKQRHFVKCLVKAIVLPVVMCGYESWTVKKAGHKRIDAFELWCWRRLLQVPWTARRSNQSILKESSPGCSLEGLMLKLKLQYFGHLMWRADSFEKILILGKIEGITDSIEMSLSTLWELLMDRETWSALIHGPEKSRTRMSNWTELTLKQTQRSMKKNRTLRNKSTSIWSQRRQNKQWGYTGFLIV